MCAARHTTNPFSAGVSSPDRPSPFFHILLPRSFDDIAVCVNLIASQPIVLPSAAGVANNLTVDQVR